MTQNVGNRRIITMDELREMEAFTAVAPHHSRTEKYQQIPTIEVVDALIQNGWVPVQAQQGDTRKEDRQGFQKHMIRMTNPNLHMGDEMVDLVLLNSHDGSSSYQVRAGVYRLVCANGMVVGTDLCGMNVRHMGFEPQDVIDASFEVVDSAERIAGSIADLKAIELSPQERYAYGTAASELLYSEKVRPEAAEMVKNPIRRADNNGTLWGTFNAVQENWTRGRTRYRRKKDNRLVKNRAPRSVEGNVKLNQALWTLTEKMAELRTA